MDYDKQRELHHECNGLDGLTPVECGTGKALVSNLLGLDRDIPLIEAINLICEYDFGFTRNQVRGLIDKLAAEAILAVYVDEDTNVVMVSTDL